MLVVTGYLNEYPSPYNLMSFVNVYPFTRPLHPSLVCRLPVVPGGYDLSNPDEANANIGHTEPFLSLYLSYNIGGDSSVENNPMISWHDLLLS